MAPNPVTLPLYHTDCRTAIWVTCWLSSRRDKGGRLPAFFSTSILSLPCTPCTAAKAVFQKYKPSRVPPSVTPVSGFPFSWDETQLLGMASTACPMSPLATSPPSPHSTPLQIRSNPHTQACRLLLKRGQRLLSQSLWILRECFLPSYPSPWLTHSPPPSSARTFAGRSSQAT